MKVSQVVIVLLLVIILGVVAYTLFTNRRNSPSNVVYHNNYVRRRPYEWGEKMHPMFSASPTYIVRHNHKNVPHAPAPAPADSPNEKRFKEPFKMGVEVFGNKKLCKCCKEPFKMGVEV